jgi:hypothetical protein
MDVQKNHQSESEPDSGEGPKEWALFDRVKSEGAHQDEQPGVAPEESRGHSWTKEAQGKPRKAGTRIQSGATLTEGEGHAAQDPDVFRVLAADESEAMRQQGMHQTWQVQNRSESRFLGP